MFSGDTEVPSIFNAPQDQLGLRLEPAKGPVEILVIDRVEKPSEINVDAIGRGVNVCC